MIHRLLRGFLSLVLLLLVLMPDSALANSAPPRWHGDKPGTLVPGSSASIHVLREELTFDLNSGDRPLTSAAVQAVYVMENRGEALSQYPVIFAVQTIAGSAKPTVTWNDTPVAVEPVAREQFSAAGYAAMEEAWTAMDQVIDPVTGELYGTDGFFEAPTLQLYQFSLDLPVGVRGTLAVRFDQAGAWDRTRQLHRIYHYQYLLLPARSWASFGPLTIAVTAPGPDAVFFDSTVPMTYQDGAYRVSLPGLPEQNLAFAVMSREGIIGNMTSPGSYYWIAFFLLLIWASAVGYGLGRLTGLIRSRGWAVAVALLSGLLAGGAADVFGSVMALGLFEKALSEQGYGLPFAILGQSLVATILTTVVGGVVAGRANRRRQGGEA